MKSAILIICFVLAASAALAYPTENDDAFPDEVMLYTPDTTEQESSQVDDTIYFEPTSPEISSTAVVVDVAATTEPQNEVMDIDAVQDMMYEFTNFTSTGLNTTQILTRISLIELNIQNSTMKLRQEIEHDTQKLNQLNSVLGPMLNIKTKLSELEEHMNNLTNVIGSLGKANMGLSLVSPVNRPTTNVRQSAWATLYRSRGHSGRTYQLDFRTCLISEDCCRNLADLDNDSQSINTHDTCVKMFKDRDCSGDSQEFYPGSASNHGDFGIYNDVFSSGKPCTSA